MEDSTIEKVLLREFKKSVERSDWKISRILIAIAIDSESDILAKEMNTIYQENYKHEIT